MPREACEQTERPKLPKVTAAQDYWAFWQAYDADALDGAEDAGPQIVGIGRTEEDAVANFITLWEDRYVRP